MIKRRQLIAGLGSAAAWPVAGGTSNMGEHEHVERGVQNLASLPRYRERWRICDDIGPA